MLSTQHRTDRPASQSQLPKQRAPADYSLGSARRGAGRSSEAPGRHCPMSQTSLTPRMVGERAGTSTTGRVFLWWVRKDNPQWICSPPKQEPDWCIIERSAPARRPRGLVPRIELTGQDRMGDHRCNPCTGGEVVSAENHHPRLLPTRLC